MGEEGAQGGRKEQKIMNKKCGEAGGTGPPGRRAARGTSVKKAAAESPGRVSFAFCLQNLLVSLNEQSEKNGHSPLKSPLFFHS